MITFRQILSPKGHINRRTFFLSFALFMIVSFVLVSLASALADSSINKTVKSVLAYILYCGLLLVYYMNIMMAVKRLHDLNYSGWWILLIILFPFLPYAISHSDIWQYDESGILFLICMAVFIAQSLFTIYLFLMPGKMSYSRFGERPLRLNRGQKSLPESLNGSDHFLQRH